MPLTDPNLDDRNFEQLFTELRSRIPAYTPDWTDYNESDPGIVMLQLFCWLQEMQIWRLNQVPQKNYVKFLQYIAQDLRPAAAATVELQFTLSSKSPNQFVTIPAGTRVQSAASSTSPVVFTTDQEIIAIPGAIAQVQVFDGGFYTVISQDQITAQTPFAPFSNQPQANAALLLGFDLPFPITGATPLQFSVHAVRADGAVIVKVDETIGSVILPANVVWEYYSGDPQNWTPLAGVRDTTLALTQIGAVNFTVSGNPAQVASQIGALQRPSDPLLYWVRCRIDSLLGPGFQSVPMIEDVATNMAPATNAQLQDNELLGASTGLPNQTFSISNVPILPDVTSNQPSSEISSTSSNPKLIQVDEGKGFVAWTQVGDFNSSKPTDTNFTLDSSTGLVTFGNGKKGKIPALLIDPSGAVNNAANIKTGMYRSGGGSAGNSDAGTINILADAVLGVQSVTNPRPATGGADEETVDEAKDRLPIALRTSHRAVIAEDFAGIAKLTPGVQIVRAYALAQFHPLLSVARAPLDPTILLAQSFVPFPGVVTVFIIPDVADDNPKPTPSIAVCNLVAKQLDASRLITTEVYVTSPNYRKVEVEVSVIVDPRLALSAVEGSLNTKLLTYFNPIHGGDDGDGWDFGGVVSITDALRQIVTTDGVIRVVPGTFKVFVDGKQYFDDTKNPMDVPLAVNEIVYSDGHSIQVAYA